MAESDIPKRVFAVVAVSLFAAFFLSMPITGALVDKAAPYAYFGVDATRSQHITITVNQRHLIRFSNGVEISGVTLWRLTLICMAIFTVVVLTIFFTFLQLAAFVIALRDPEWADDVVHFTKFAPESEG